MMLSSVSHGYDVFISFRGDDTRTGFISHLDHALTQKHIKTFKDDKSLEIGNFIASELLHAIEASRFAIVVLSSNFATSKWCLEELAKVVDCMERGNLTVIPVFYHVSPSDVRHQTDSFKQGFADHEANPEITPQKVKTWRAAFEKVGAIKGSHITPQRNESEIVSEILRKVIKDFPVTLPAAVTDELVGIDSRVDEVKSILSMESNEVRLIGICGMSGMGKTTLAEVVYKRIQKNFQGSCFIENIKDVSKKNDSTHLCKLQKKLLDDILKDNIHVQSVVHGKTLLETMLHHLKILIVLDDVNHEDQLTYLAGGREWFGPGSRIIVTTTNNYLLDPDIVHEIYTCEEMKCAEALRLFCQSAFKKEYPPRGYDELSYDIVKLAGGLPLALNVYGRLLHGKEEKYWKHMLNKLQKYPDEKVLGRLETVYYRLDRDQRITFIYIACFLKGRHLDLVKDILNSLRLDPECAIPDLINKFLISINHDDSVWVHDLLQQMCWEVLRKESERHDAKRIAIKNSKDVEYILLEPEGTRSIEIINQEPNEFEGSDFVNDYNCLSKMIKLKFLKIGKICFHQGLDRLSNELRILEWYGCSLKSLPTVFEPHHIFEIEMCYSQLETLWEKYLDLPNLRSINLSFSRDLTKLPDLTSTLNLDKLNLEGCTNLAELHESVLLQKRLRYMNLKGCTRLRNLGANTMELEALEALILSGCSNLEYLPEFGQNMKRLEHLFVDGTSIKKLPENLWQMCDLRKLDVSGTSIEELPSFIHSLGKLRLLCVNRCPLSHKTGGFLYTNLDTLSSRLRELDLSYCNLSLVPAGIGLLQRLVNLDLSGNDFISMPANISLLSNLRLLCLNDCKSLQSLPKLSMVNEDTRYGLQIRFSYYVSREGVDLSEFQATSNSSNTPTISCLKCPKLADDETGSYLADEILNSYLHLRPNYWNTPEAVFEIVGAGNIIPSGFKLLESDDMILESWWIGVAICAVVSVHHSNAYLKEAKYVVTAHIHVGEKHWKISVPVKFLVPGLDNQLVFYWTVAADDLHSLVDSSNKYKCRFSFSVEPGDGNLQVTKFGVRFIRDVDFLELKLLKYSTRLVVSSVLRGTLSLPNDLRNLLACKAWAEYEYNHSDLANDMEKILNGSRKQQNYLDVIQNIIIYLHEANQEVISECRDAQLFLLVYNYARISHGISELCNEFVRLLKDVVNSWISVKFALKQFEVNGRANGYTYEEMQQQLNDLEAVKSVRVSDSFVIEFAHICKQIATIVTHLNEVTQGNIKFNSLKVLIKVLGKTIAVIYSTVATYMCDSELLQGIKFKKPDDIWYHMIKVFSSNIAKWTDKTRRYPESKFDREFQIRDFSDSAILLQELKNKISWSSASKENEEEMMIIINKLDKNIDNLSITTEDISSLAYKYSQDIWEARISFDRFITEGKLQVTAYGVHFRRDEDILQLKRFEDPMREAVTNLFRAAAFLPATLCSYIHVYEYEAMIPCHLLKSVLDTKQDSFFDILQIIRCFYVQVSLTKDDLKELRNARLNAKLPKLELGNHKLLQSFRNMLVGIFENWTTVRLAMEQILLKSKSGKYTYEEMLQQLNDVKAAENIGFSDEFVTSFEYICDETVAFMIIMNSVIYNEELEAPFLSRFSLIYRSKKLKWMRAMKQYGKILSLIVNISFSIVAACMGEFGLLQEMVNMTYSKATLLRLIQCFSRNSGKWFDERGCIKKTSYVGELRIWDCYGNVILLQELKNKMSGFDCLTKEAEEAMTIAIHKLEKKHHALSSVLSDIL